MQRRGNIKTIGLRINDETLDSLHKVSKEILKNLESKYGLDITEGSTLMRLAISNLLANPPDDKNIQGLIISCKNDETFGAFVKNILEEVPAN